MLISARRLLLRSYPRTAPRQIPRVCRAVAEKLARFKHPRRYEILDALPRSIMGKVRKEVLRRNSSESSG